MSVEPEKLKGKWYKNWWNYLFLLILLLFIASLCVMSIGGQVTPSKESGYNEAKLILRNAVNDYYDSNNGDFPSINGTVTINHSSYRIINICQLLTQNEELLEEDAFYSLWSGNGSNDDNCDGGCAQCHAYSHYIWAVDDEGNIYSTCVGASCNTSGVDGYQDVWP
jgi:hypothetical protein